MPAPPVASGVTRPQRCHVDQRRRAVKVADEHHAEAEKLIKQR